MANDAQSSSDLWKLLATALLGLSLGWAAKSIDANRDLAHVRELHLAQQGMITALQAASTSAERDRGRMDDRREALEARADRLEARVLKLELPRGAGGGK